MHHCYTAFAGIQPRNTYSTSTRGSLIFESDEKWALISFGNVGSRGASSTTQFVNETRVQEL